MLDHASLILPDFALILAGFLLARSGSFERGFWTGIEKLAYYVLFPALLVNSILSARYDFASEALLLAAIVGALLIVIAAAFVSMRIVAPDRDFAAATVQCAFRFNSYIAFALAQSLAGARGLALMALALAVCVPIVNVFAVAAMARQRQTHLLRELAANPLILATLGGLAGNILGLQLPQFVAHALTRLGAASIALALLCVGAALSLGAMQGQQRAMAVLTAIKLLLFPLLAYALGRWLQLPPDAMLIAVLFAALPTATSTYVLTARMGFDAVPVSRLITLQTLLAMVTLPLWVALVSR